MLAEVTARPPTAESEALRNFVRAQLTLEVDPDVINPFSKNVNRDQILRDRIRAAVMQRDVFPTPLLLETLFDEIVGLGPLEPLMADPDITDILVNRFDEIYLFA